MRYQTLLFFCFFFCFLNSIEASNTYEMTPLDTLPYYQIPEAPMSYNAASVVARMVDGLGYRYFWATKDLRAEDLAFEPGNDGQSCSEVLTHILGLSRFLLRTIKNEVHDNSVTYPELSWKEQRKATLQNIKMASDILRATGDVSGLDIVFKRGEETSELPFWNLLNGPLADAIYHTGQIVSYRRSSGNPINPNVSVLRGKTRE
ncbi:MAG: hypothetical protein P1U56_15240 [Saprospiraceae bacterium]|nr:hypothetical protein [Saprospiraceae bacterium]